MEAGWDGSLKIEVQRSWIVPLELTEQLLLVQLFENRAYESIVCYSGINFKNLYSCIMSVCPKYFQG